MRKKFHLVTVGIMLLGSTLACSLGSSTGTTVSDDTATSANGNVLFQDDFSDSKSGWTTDSYSSYRTEYVDGGFRVYVEDTQSDYWATANVNLSDVNIVVDATKQGGSDDNDFGVICRYQDSSNFYAFVISSDGYYGISVMQDGDLYMLTNEQMEYTDLINQGSATNKITAICNDTTLSLYVNDTLLVETEDSSYSSGDIGLLAGTYDTGGTDILFDNMVVTKPE